MTNLLGKNDDIFICLSVSVIIKVPGGSSQYK